MLITPFQFLRLTGGVTTSTAMETLESFPVEVLHVGKVLLDLRATIQMRYVKPSAQFLGVALRYVWDDLVLVDPGFFQFDPAFGPPNIDTYAMHVTMRSVIEAAAPGPHVLLVQWQVLDVEQEATLFPLNGNLTVEGK